MDPLDQRLTDAGIAWRQTQPEPPDLDPMIVALRRRGSGRFSGRLMFALVAALLLAAALAVAPGVGSLLQQVQPPVPVVASPSPSVPSSQAPASAAPTPSSPAPSPSVSPNDRLTATDLVDRYETALVAGKWQTAFDLLAPTSLTREAGLDAFAAERAQYFVSVDGQWVIGSISNATDWESWGPTVAGAERSRAYLVEVDYPALSGNNAGYEQFVVAPDAGGTWRIWPVR